MSDPHIICTTEPKMRLLKHFNENFDSLKSIQISQGYYFQIRIKKERFENLPQETQDTLREYSNADDDLGRQFEVGSEKERLWLETNYWAHCDAYLFNVNINDAYWLSFNCEYGHDGLEESDQIVFVNNLSIPEIVWRNRGTSEYLDDFRAYSEGGKEA